MKHTDVLLKIPSDELKREEVENKVERSKAINLLQTRLRMIHDLNQTEGWKFFVEELRVERFKLLSMLERSNDPTTLAKVTGTLLAVESFIDWPATVSRELEGQAKDMSLD